MSKEVIDVLKQVRTSATEIEEWIIRDQIDINNVADGMASIASVIETVKKIVPASVYEPYGEFFEIFSRFCRQCADIKFFVENKEELISSFKLFEECIEDLINNYRNRTKKCPCCGREVVYEPISDYYRQMAEKYQTVDKTRPETLNKEEHFCPGCGARDRDRLIISFLEKEGLQEACEGMRVLQIAPVACISAWIKACCPHIAYETTDLCMDSVSFQSDIMNMDMISNETYDVIICAHVLEHVRDDRKALSEMKRILKSDGKIIFLVPIDLDVSGIDEEWGLSEAENWKRFGQGDRCRTYDKNGLMERLGEEFYVHSLGKEYFGEDIFQQCALTDTSTLYVLTKSDQASLNLAEDLQIDEKLCHDGPLVSVILPCYNHEQYVAEVIESIINQSYKNMELIVGDDGSTDGTASVMRKYSSHFTKEFYFEKNTDDRLWEHMNKIASGKYIAIAHSDDIWEKDKIALQVAYMESHPECGACFTWCKYREETGKELNELTFIQPNRDRYEWMDFFWKYGNVLCHPSVLIRCDIHDRMRRHAGRQLPDFFRWLEIVQMSSIHIIPKILVRMRRHKECTSFPSKENIIRSLLEDACGWMWVIRNMEDDFFRKTFAPYMRDPEAVAVEEIQCEKFFLMLDSRKPLMQYSAMYYYFNIFDEAKGCLRDKYHYTTNEFAKDIIKISQNLWLNEKAIIGGLHA